jgi:predicted RecA/RadA family phage recombinase
MISGYKEGKTWNWKNGTGSSAANGSIVVIGRERLGIATVAIANGSTGSVASEGIFEVTKVGSQAWAVGQRVFYNGTAFTTALALNSYFAGYAAETVGSGSGETTGYVRLAPFSEEGPRYLADGGATIALAAQDFYGGHLTLNASVAGTATVTLPPVATLPIGLFFTVLKSGTSGAITIDLDGTEQINGGNTYTALDAQNDIASFINTGAAVLLGPRNIA